MATEANSNDADESYFSCGRSDENIERFESELGASLKKRLKEKDKDFNKKIEKLVERSFDCIHVSEFLHNYLFGQSNEDFDESIDDTIPLAELGYFNELLQKKEDISDKLNKISQENIALENKIIKKKMQLKNSMKERNQLWDKAVELVTAASENMSLAESDTNISIVPDETDTKYRCKKLWKAIEKDYYLIQKIACILHRLISFSGIKWANEKNLLEIVLCTGRIMNTTFNENNLKEAEKMLDECTVRLNKVKCEHMK